jgi:hypothetical protein
MGWAAAARMTNGSPIVHRGRFGSEEVGPVGVPGHPGGSQSNAGGFDFDPENAV